MKPLHQTFILLALMLLSIALLAYAAKAQESADLEVLVIDNDGNLRPGIEVILSNETFRKSFKTSSDGVAVFKLLSPGKYDLSVIIDGIRVGYSEVDFPSMRKVELKLQLGALKCKVTDVDGHNVEALEITVRSESGKIVKTGKTAADGSLVIKDLPFSSLLGVGKYYITARLQNATVISEVVEYPTEQDGSLPLLARVAKLNFKITDSSGDPLQQGKLVLTANNYTSALQIKNGEVVAGELPTSSVVGIYNARLVLSYPEFKKELTLLSEAFSLDKGINKTYVADVDRLVINLIDDEGTPVRGIKIILSTERHGNLTSSISGRDGKAIFNILPFSVGTYGVGNYRAMILKDKTPLSSFTFSFTPALTSVNYTLSRMEAVFDILKPSGEPLAGAVIKLQDPITGTSSEAVTDSGGVARARIFPGRLLYSVTYLNDVVDSGEINIQQERLSITVRGIDINLAIRLVDWLGSPVGGLEVVVYKGDQELQTTKTGTGEYSVTVPSRGVVTIDILSDGKVIERRRLIITEPAVETIRLRGLSMGGGLVGMETIAAVAACLFFLCVSILSAVLILRKIKPAAQARK